MQRAPDSTVIEAGQRALSDRRTSGRGGEDIVLANARGSLVWDLGGRECDPDSTSGPSQPHFDRLSAPNPTGLTSAWTRRPTRHRAPSRCARGVHTAERPREMQQRHPLMGDVRCSGSMGHLELVQDRETKEPSTAAPREIARRSTEHGVVFGESRDTGLGDIITVERPLDIPCARLEWALDPLDEVIGGLGAEGVRDRQW